MAKPRVVTGIEPDRRLRPNAQRIMRVRIGEVYQYDGLVSDPRNVRDLHDMRIAFKRLRYLLEIFGPAFRADLEPFLEEVKGMQDLLGDIHDCDVQIPMLGEHLAWLEAREAEAVLALAAPPEGKVDGSVEARIRAFRGRLDEARRADERPGIHTLIARRRAERIELYDRFLREWRRLKRECFRQRLEEALGIGG